MIPLSRLQEFGFADEGRFPRRLTRHAVTMSLPSALEHGVEPLEVIVEDGLVVPLQRSGSSSGMIIRNDGAMLYVAHQDQKDPASPLEARFIKEIPYDARNEVSNIMHRAVHADPSLADIWRQVSMTWLDWFPALKNEGAIQPAGEFTQVAKAWDMTGELIGRLIEKVQRSFSGEVNLKVVVQSEADFKKGWLGEDILVDERTLREVTAQGRVKYLLQFLFPRMQKVLSSPVFHPRSTFRLYYGSSSVYIVKLVVVPPADQPGVPASSAGVALLLPALEGYSPSME
ncbi:MAG: hypothetical protein HQL20_07730 [Candidatus Omnitrophica bacterium]|nr:hypothetical protein [Candidatus Omnitrophota bacterium]